MNTSIASSYLARAIGACAECLVGTPSLRKATSYLSPSYTVKASRQRRQDRRDSRETFIMTFGSPNYLERKFIKLAKKAGEPFPIKTIQLKFWPKKKPH